MKKTEQYMIAKTFYARKLQMKVENYGLHHASCQKLKIGQVDPM